MAAAGQCSTSFSTEYITSTSNLVSTIVNTVTDPATTSTSSVPVVSCSSVLDAIPVCTTSFSDSVTVIPGSTHTDSTTTTITETITSSSVIAVSTSCPPSVSPSSPGQSSPSSTPPSSAAPSSAPSAPPAHPTATSTSWSTTFISTTGADGAPTLVPSLVPGAGGHHHKGSVSTVAIGIGSAIGGIVALLGIVWAVWWCMKGRTRESKELKWGDDMFDIDRSDGLGAGTYAAPARAAARRNPGFMDGESDAGWDEKTGPPGSATHSRTPSAYGGPGGSRAGTPMGFAALPPGPGSYAGHGHHGSLASSQGGYVGPGAAMAAGRGGGGGGHSMHPSGSSQSGYQVPLMANAAPLGYGGPASPHMYPPPSPGFSPDLAAQPLLAGHSAGSSQGAGGHATSRSLSNLLDEEAAAGAGAAGVMVGGGARGPGRPKRESMPDLSPTAASAPLVDGARDRRSRQTTGGATETSWTGPGRYMKNGTPERPRSGPPRPSFEGLDSVGPLPAASSSSPSTRVGTPVNGIRKARHTPGPSEDTMIGNDEAAGTNSTSLHYQKSMSPSEKEVQRHSSMWNSPEVAEEKRRRRESYQNKHGRGASSVSSLGDVLGSPTPLSPVAPSPTTPAEARGASEPPPAGHKSMRAHREEGTFDEGARVGLEWLGGLISHN